MKTKIHFKIVSVLIIMCFICSFASQVIAATQAELNDLKQKKQEAENEKASITAEKKEAKTELESLTEQVNQTQDEINSLKAQITEVSAEIDKKIEEIDKEQKEIDAKNKLLQDRMVALYEAGDASYLDLLLSSESIIDFISSYNLIQTILEADTNLINELEEIKAKLENDKTELEEKKQKVEDLKNEQEIKNATLMNLQSKKQAQVDKLSEDEKAKQAEIDSYNSAIERVNNELASAWSQAQSAGSSGLHFDGSFIWPCNCKIVTSGMKYRWGRLHKGIDIGASYENVYAAASGYAYNASNPGGYGTYIMIIHGDGYVTLYGHLSSSHISSGQYVSQGQVIATSGNTGSSTGPHLHFEIRRASSMSDFFSKSPLNPLDYLPGGWTSTAGAFTTS